MCVNLNKKFISRRPLNSRQTPCLTSHIAEWRKCWPEDGLHPLSCLHGHMCVFIDSPLAHPSNKSPPTRRQFSPPSAVWLRWGVLCSMADSSRRLAVSQPTWRHQGVATGTRRQDPRLENAFFVPPFELKGANAKQAPSSAEWKDNTAQGARGNMKAYVCVYAY